MRNASIGLIVFALCAAANADMVDDFESGDLSKWSIHKFNDYGNNITWSLVQDGTQVWEGFGGLAPPGGGGGGSIQYLAGLDVPDVSVTAKVKTQDIINPGFHSGIVARYTDPQHGYELTMTGSWDVSNLALSKRTLGGLIVLGWADLPESHQPGTTWNTMRLDVVGDHLMAYCNGILYFDIYDDTFSSGSVGLRNGGGATRFDDFSATVVPLPGAALLGCLGLSFAGWRLHRRPA